MKKVLLSFMAITVSLIVSYKAAAESKWVRLGWQNNASTTATISFTPSGNNNNAYVKFGYESNESNWQSKAVTFTTNMASITTKHARLTELTANSAVYFRICDDAGCGDRFWFKTAPADNTPYVFVAGGDTRTGWTNRREGNKLIAKIRPLFVMHGGDFTDYNNRSQWIQWLKDWELSYSSDVINGLSYKRIYPMISTHGNHEDSDISTICKMFGVDPNQSDTCSANDTFYSVAISPLMRVYTLNSQFMREGTALQRAQNNWLSSDLSNMGQTTAWRVAQYHKPMFPHYRGKSDNQILFNWWAEDFYEHGMNLVVESDTHLTKLTDVVKPSGSNFTTTQSGTVYVGEGSWGAPARSANDAKSWTLDLASIQQFKVITVSESQMDIRTAQFNGTPSSLSRADRDANPTLLPSGINWWTANGVGEVMALKTDINKRSVMISNDVGDNVTATLKASDDTFITSRNANQNHDESTDQLLADGSDVQYGEMQSLIKWDTTELPSCSKVEVATITLDIFNPSSGSYHIYSGRSHWTEDQVTWNSVNGDNQQGTLLGSFTPGSKGKYSVQLNAAGKATVEGWIRGVSNYGVVIASAGTIDGIDFSDKESGFASELVIKYNESECDGDINQAPIAEFSTQLNGLTAAFSDKSTDPDGQIVQWQWLFGDGESSDVQNTNHIFASAGEYQVTLTVTDNEGARNSQTTFINVIDPDQSTRTTVVLEASDDTFISSRRKSTNYDEHRDELLADASDSTYGSMQTLIKWDVSEIPSCANIEQASVILDVFNRSSGTYDIFAGKNTWQENTVTWQAVNGGSHKGRNVGSFIPNSTKVYNVDLNANGLSMIQSWLQGLNYGVVIASGGTRNGIDIHDHESNRGPKISITYNLDQCNR